LQRRDEQVDQSLFLFQSGFLIKNHSLKGWWEEREAFYAMACNERADREKPGICSRMFPIRDILAGRVFFAATQSGSNRRILYKKWKNRRFQPLCLL